MADSSRSKVSHHAEAEPEPESSVGENGLAIMPPRYGIDILDNYSQDQAIALSESPFGIQRQASSESSAPTSNFIPPSVYQTLEQPGQALDGQSRQYMESHFGHNFDSVRIHTDNRAAQSAQDIQANAYTVGQNVVFADNQFQPNTASGKQLLAHELSHVIQQNNAPQNQNLTIDMQSAAEQDANQAANQVSQGNRGQVHSRSKSAIQRQEAAGESWYERRLLSAKQAYQSVRTELADAGQAVKDVAVQGVAAVQEVTAQVQAQVVSAVTTLQDKGVQAYDAVQAKFEKAKQIAKDIKQNPKKALVQVGKQVKQVAGEKVMGALGSIKGILMEGASLLDIVYWLSMKLHEVRDTAVVYSLPYLLKQLRTSGADIPYKDQEVIDFYESFFGVKGEMKQLEKMGLAKRNPITGKVEVNLAGALSEWSDKQAETIEASIGMQEDRGVVFTSYELGELQGSVGVQIALALVGVKEVEVVLKVLGAIGAVKGIFDSYDKSIAQKTSLLTDENFWVALFNIVLSIIGLKEAKAMKKLVKIITSAGLVANLVPPVMQFYRDYKHPDPKLSADERDKVLARDFANIVKGAKDIVFAILHSQMQKPQTGGETGKSATSGETAAPSKAPAESTSAPHETPSTAEPPSPKSAPAVAEAPITTSASALPESLPPVTEVPVLNAAPAPTDVGLADRGYRPKPGERTTTKEQWKAQSGQERWDRQADVMLEKGDITSKPLVEIPARESGEPARVLEVGAGPRDVDLGLPLDPHRTAANPNQVDASLVSVTKTDIDTHGGKRVQLDATQPLPPEMRGQFDTVIVNNPRGYPSPQTPGEFIANVGQAVHPNGKIILQGNSTANPDFRPMAEAVTTPESIPKKATPVGTPPLSDERIASDRPLAPGYRVSKEQTVVSTAKVRQASPTEPEVPAHVMGSDFRRTDDTKPVVPNTRIVIEKTGGGSPPPVPIAPVKASTPTGSHTSSTAQKPVTEAPVKLSGKGAANDNIEMPNNLIPIERTKQIRAERQKQAAQQTLVKRQRKATGTDDVHFDEGSDTTQPETVVASANDNANKGTGETHPPSNTSAPEVAPVQSSSKGSSSSSESSNKSKSTALPSDVEIDHALGNLETTAKSDTYVELPAGPDVKRVNPATGKTEIVPENGVTSIEIEAGKKAGDIALHENITVTGAKNARVVEHRDLLKMREQGKTSSTRSVIPDDSPDSPVAKAPVPLHGETGQPRDVMVRTHTANPKAPEGSHSHDNPTLQVNSTGKERQLTPDGRWIRMGDPTVTPADRASTHYPVGEPNPANNAGQVPPTSTPAGTPPTPTPKGTPPASVTSTPADERIRMFHGTTNEGYESLGGGGKGKISVAHSSGENQDFGRGFYLSEDVSVAQSAAKPRTSKELGGAQQILAFEVSVKELGVLVDVRRDGPHRAQWEAFLNEPAFPEVPSYKVTVREHLSRGQGMEQRGTYFEKFLDRIGMKNADTIVGPIGDVVTSGAVQSKRGESTQIVIRTQAIADKLNKMIRGEQ